MRKECIRLNLRRFSNNQSKGWQVKNLSFKVISKVQDALVASSHITMSKSKPQLTKYSTFQMNSSKLKSLWTIDKAKDEFNQSIVTWDKK